MKSSSLARRGGGEQLKGLIELERRCLTLREEVDHLSECQEVMADLMVSMKDMQKTAPEMCEEKIFEEFKEMEEERAQKSFRARTKEAHADRVGRRKGKGKDQRKGWRSREQKVHGPEATTILQRFLHNDIHTDEAMSASSRMAQEVDEAMSESSWTALAKWKERDWWSIDLEGEVQKVEVICPWSGTKGDSVEPKGEMGHKSDRTMVIREAEEKFKEDEMEVDVDAPEGESVETKSPKKCDSNRIRSNTRLEISRKKHQN